MTGSPQTQTQTSQTQTSIGERRRRRPPRPGSGPPRCFWRAPGTPRPSAQTTSGRLRFRSNLRGARKLRGRRRNGKRLVWRPMARSGQSTCHASDDVNSQSRSPGRSKSDLPTFASLGQSQACRKRPCPAISAYSPLRASPSAAT